MSADLKALGDIIQLSIANVLSVCEKAGEEFPSLNEPVHPSEFTPQGIRNRPEIAQSIGLIVAAATQLIATVQPPPLTLTTDACKYTLTAALGVVEAGNVPEILREAGPEGLHINEIAKKSDMAPVKLARFMRLLATNHWFREVSPDVFTNNMLSSLLDTGKSVKDIERKTKFENIPGLGFAAFAAMGADEALKCSSYIVEAMTDPKTKFSEEANESAGQKAFGIDMNMFDFYDTPEGEERRKRFAVVMSLSGKLQPPEAVLTAYEWSSLPEGAIVVDVGGGLGHVSLEIAKTNQHLHVVVEDRPSNIEQAMSFWQENLPSFVSAGKVDLIGINFFEPQPKLSGTPSVYLLRWITHDWSDKYAIKLLRHLRDAAGPNTKLVILDSVLDYACGSDGPQPKPPYPLLGNMGGASALAYAVDVQVFCGLNAGERTANGFKEILSASGWQLEEMRRNPAMPSWWPSIISSPM